MIAVAVAVGEALSMGASPTAPAADQQDRRAAQLAQPANDPKPDIGYAHT